MVGASVTYTARAVLTDGLDGGLRLRTLLEAPDVPTQNCDRRADQRGRDEEPLEAQAFDDEARGAREQAPGQGAELNHVYFEKRSFSSSGSRWSLTQRRSAMTKGSRFRRTSKSAARRVRSSALAWQ